MPLLLVEDHKIPTRQEVLLALVGQRQMYLSDSFICSREFLSEFLSLHDARGRSDWQGLSLRVGGAAVFLGGAAGLPLGGAAVLPPPDSVCRLGRLPSQNCLHYNETIIAQHQSQHPK